MPKLTETPIDDLIALSENATRTSSMVVHHECQVALYTLARMVSEWAPSAKYLVLTQSDQGTWMTYELALDEDGEEIDASQADALANADVIANRLYLEHSDVWNFFGDNVPNKIRDALGSFDTPVPVQAVLDLPPAAFNDVTLYFVGDQSPEDSLPFDSFESADSYAEDNAGDLTIFSVTFVALPDTQESM